MNTRENVWPRLTGLDVRATTDTLHLWTQVAGKVRLMLTPWINHSWHVPLYVSVRGLTTGPMSVPGRTIEIEFDLITDRLLLSDSGGRHAEVALVSQSVAGFYAATMKALDDLGLPVKVDPVPCEIADPIAFHDDQAPRTYDGATARAFWRALLETQRVFQIFRSRFSGKCSPIHFFWGSFDLAVTRFSGRPAPQHPGGVPHLPDAVVREAYSHEVSSAGFWPGNGTSKPPSFYSYAYPSPQGFSKAPVQPREAYFDDALGEFLLPYDVVQMSEDPDGTLLRFLQSTYEAAATLAHWDRASLERPSGLIGKPSAPA